MIIGLSGLSGTGKDTVADILVKNFNFSKIGLSDPMKRICKDVFDFTDEQLWGPSEKRNEPDKRYRKKPYLHMTNSVAVYDPKYNEPRRCSSCGEEGPPPSDDGRHFSSEKCFHYLTPRFALQKLGTEFGMNCYDNVWVEYALKMAKDLLEFKRHEVEYDPKRGIVRATNHWLETPGTAVEVSFYDSNGRGLRIDSSWDPRRLAKPVRTDITLQPGDILRLLGDKYCPPSDGSLGTSYFYLVEGKDHKFWISGTHLRTPFRQMRGVVIPDVRFKSDVEGLKKVPCSMGSVKLVRVKRPGYEKPRWDHASETEQMEINDNLFDFIIDNNKSIEDLEEKVKEILPFLINDKPKESHE